MDQKILKKEDHEFTSLTQNQKLLALEQKYYSFQVWEPKKWDYYTTARSDLELYRIVDIDESNIYTKYCDPERGDSVSSWYKDEFLEDFGKVRVHIPDWIFEE